MTPQWPTCREKELLSGLSAVPEGHDDGAPVFVVDDNERFRGLLDLESRSATASGQHPAIRHATVVRADARLEELFALFAVSDAPVPVVDDEGKLLGGVERRNAMSALAESNVDANGDTTGNRRDPAVVAEMNGP
jgi:Mg/Co/Ni transporter MgtE